MSELKVFLADDHPVVRGGLRTLIDAQPDMAVVGEAYDGEATVEAAARLRPDVVVMDVSMPGIGGVEATARIRRANPGARVVALTAHEDRGYLRQMLAAGAAGYVLKRSAAEDLVRAVRAVAAGGRYLDRAVAGSVVDDFVRAQQAGEARAELSEREDEVLRLIALGYANKEVASRLKVSVKTVETYKARSMKKLGARSRVDIVRYAAGRGWIGNAVEAQGGSPGNGGGAGPE